MALSYHRTNQPTARVQYAPYAAYCMFISKATNHFLQHCEHGTDASLASRSTLSAWACSKPNHSPTFTKNGPAVVFSGKQQSLRRKSGMYFSPPEATTSFIRAMPSSSPLRDSENHRPPERGYSHRSPNRLSNMSGTTCRDSVGDTSSGDSCSKDFGQAASHSTSLEACSRGLQASELVRKRMKNANASAVHEAANQDFLREVHLSRVKSLKLYEETNLSHLESRNKGGTLDLGSEIMLLASAVSLAETRLLHLRLLF